MSDQPGKGRWLEIYLAYTIVGIRGSGAQSQLAILGGALVGKFAAQDDQVDALKLIAIKRSSSGEFVNQDDTLHFDSVLHGKYDVKFNIKVL